jgi:hypothetical protein
VNLFADTSVWSLALRRDAPPGTREVSALANALESGDLVFTTGLVLQELLQGLAGPKARSTIVSRFAALPFVVPDRADHIAAADLRNACRRRGVQVGTIDALLAQICIRRNLIMLTMDRDFLQVARIGPLRVWKG